MPYKNPEDERAQDRRYYAAHREKKLERNRRWRAAHQETMRELHRGWDEDNRDKRLEWRRTLRHGITRTIRDWMYESQGGACAGCRSRMFDAELYVDHDHACCPGPFSCGRCVRGLLCPACNLRDALAQSPPASQS